MISYDNSRYTSIIDSDSVHIVNGIYLSYDDLSVIIRMKILHFTGPHIMDMLIL